MVGWKYIFFSFSSPVDIVEGEKIANFADFDEPGYECYLYLAIRNPCHRDWWLATSW